VAAAPAMEVACESEFGHAARYSALTTGPANVTPA
jgi:hypothetical protein